MGHHDTSKRRALLLRGLICSSIAVAAFDCTSEVRTTADQGATSGEAATGGSTSGTAATGGAAPLPSCVNPQPVLFPDQTPSGYVRCSDGSINRVSSEACSIAVSAPACANNDGFSNCSSDADCTDKPNGVCGHVDYGCGGASSGCECLYPCATDSDCAEGEVCRCDGVLDGTIASTCVPADCRTGADCASGECGVAVNNWTDGTVKIDFGCRTPSDTCRSNDHCNGPKDPLCLGPEWSCSNLNLGGCGRALTIGSHVRVAPSAARETWLAEIRVDVSQLTAAEREALAAEWTEMALFEHASVASFSRFALQLMQLGAPPELLHETHRAALDEIEHARVAFAVASAYAGRPVGPGPLDMTGLTLAVDRSEVIRNLVVEACVSETLGVLELRERADTLADPAVGELLHAIADDEERHAALAWRCLAWLLSAADDETRLAVSRSFEQARDNTRPQRLREAYELVVIPCAAAVGLSAAA